MSVEKKAEELKPAPEVTSGSEQKQSKKRNVRKMMLAHLIFSPPIALKKP
jgi:hypothetical protein